VLSVFSLVVSGAVTVGFYYVVNSMQNLVLSCVFEALTSLGISLVYCVIVDMFPTNLRWAKYDSSFWTFLIQDSLIRYHITHYRVMAAALSLTMGRLGALIGNLVFGYLIDLACVIPIILFAAFLFGKKIFSVKFKSIRFWVCKINDIRFEFQCIQNVGNIFNLFKCSDITRLISACGFFSFLLPRTGKDTLD